MSVTIDAVGVGKRYRGKNEPALAGVDLAVPTGSVCALLGPNGAGKSTMVRILTTLTTPDSGTAVVAGHDIATDPARVRERIGLVGQSAALDEILSGRRNLELFGRLSGLRRSHAVARAAELLTEFGLTDAADRPVADYSGGMRRRLDLATSLIVAPTVLFVDEPTTGLDPAGRRDVWAAVRRLVETGVTVLLTTQYLEEADALADQVVILREGQVVAAGTPVELKSAVGQTRVELIFATATQAQHAGRVAADHASGPVQRIGDRTISVPVAGDPSLFALTAHLAGQGLSPTEFTVRRPSLDDVFLHFHQDPTADDQLEPPR